MHDPAIPSRGIYSTEMFTWCTRILIARLTVTAMKDIWSYAVMPYKIHTHSLAVFKKHLP